MGRSNTNLGRKRHAQRDRVRERSPAGNVAEHQCPNFESSHCQRNRHGRPHDCRDQLDPDATAEVQISLEHFVGTSASQTITDSARTLNALACRGLRKSSRATGPTSPHFTENDSRTAFQRSRRLGRGVRRLLLLEDDGWRRYQGSIRPAGGGDECHSRGDDTERLGREQSGQNKRAAKYDDLAAAEAEHHQEPSHAAASQALCSGRFVVVGRTVAARQVLRPGVSSATSTPGYSPRAKLDHSIARPRIDVGAVPETHDDVCGNLKYRQRY